MMRVLFLAATPDDQVRLRLGREFREIRAKIQASEHRDQIELLSDWAVRPHDLQEILLREMPHVVHFSGHGSSESQLIFEDDAGRSKEVNRGALVDLFRLLKDNIRVVVLNACFSKVQAEAITEVIDCAVGMRTEISDDAAIEFATAFYQGLAYGRSVETSFQLGCNALKISGIHGDETPHLEVRSGQDAAALFITSGTLIVPENDPALWGRVSARVAGGVLLCFVLLCFGWLLWPENERQPPASADQKSAFTVVDAATGDAIYQPLSVQFKLRDDLNPRTDVEYGQRGQFRILGRRQDIELLDVKVKGFTFPLGSRLSAVDGVVRMERGLTFRQLIEPDLDAVPKPSAEDYQLAIAKQDSNMRARFAIANHTNVAVTPIVMPWTTGSPEPDEGFEFSVLPACEGGATRDYKWPATHPGAYFFIFLSIHGLRAEHVADGNLQGESELTIHVDRIDVTDITNPVIYPTKQWSFPND